MDQVARKRTPAMRALVEDKELVENKRKLLADVATRLFREKGFHETLTRDIAQAMGTSVGALYQYIQHKEDLLVLIFQSTFDLYEEHVFPAAKVSGDALECLENFVGAYYRTLDEHHAKTDVVYHEFSNLKRKNKTYFGDIEERVLGVVREIVERGIAEGTFREISSLFVAHNIVSMGHMWALKRRRFRGAMTVEDYIAEQVAWLRLVLAPRTEA